VSRPEWLRRRNLKNNYRAIEANRRAGTVGLVGLLAAGYSQTFIGRWTASWVPATFELLALSLITTDRRLPRHVRLNRVGSLAIVTTTFLIGAAIATTGGPRSPYIPYMVLPAGMIAARFSWRVVIATLGLTMAVTLVATIGAYSHVGPGEPPSLIIKLLLIVAIVAIVWGLRAGKLLHSDESIIDPVTGLLNPNGLLLRFDQISQLVNLTGEPVSLIACDIRYFKTIDSRRGRSPDNTVLHDFARITREVIGSYQLVYRLWGGTIAIVLPGTEVQSAIRVAQQLRDAVGKMRVGNGLVGISVGISAAHGNLVDFDGLLDAASVTIDAGERARRSHITAHVREGRTSSRRRFHLSRQDATNL
jgi:diguanylate cyclase (GGDEF)-like protein